MTIHQKIIKRALFYVVNHHSCFICTALSHSLYYFKWKDSNNLDHDFLDKVYKEIILQLKCYEPLKRYDVICWWSPRNIAIRENLLNKLFVFFAKTPAEDDYIYNE